MKTSIRKVAIFLAALLVVLIVPARAAVVTKLDIPLAGIVFNPCNGEMVIFTGIDHIIERVTLDNSGGFHASFHDNIHVTASEIKATPTSETRRIIRYSMAASGLWTPQFQPSAKSARDQRRIS